MKDYKWHSPKDKPMDGVSVLACISGKVDYIHYERAYSVGEYWSDDDEWEVQEFDGIPPKGIQILGWKYIESFELEG